MAALWTDYEPEPDDNGSGTAPKRMKEGSFQGRWVNDCLRYMAAVIRNLGDACLFLPLASDGTPDATLGKHAGTIAFQNADNVEILGGVITARGAIPVGGIIPYGRTWADFLAEEASLLEQGWACADGRTVTNPFTNATVALPDLRGRYPYFFDDTGTIGDPFGEWIHTSSSNGAHAHAANNTSAASAGPSLNVSYALVSTGGGGPYQVVDNVTINAVATHVHAYTTPSAGAHTHEVDVTPPSVSCIPLMRVW